MRAWRRTVASVITAVALLAVAAWPSLAQEPSPGPTAIPSPEPTARPTPGATILPLPGVPNRPPTIVGVCSTASDHVWRISTAELDLMYYKIAYTPSFDDMSVWRASGDLERVGDEYTATVTSSRSDGPMLDVIWAYFSGMRSTAIASDVACESGGTPAASAPPEPAPEPLPTSVTPPDDPAAFISMVFDLWARILDAIAGS